MPLALKLWKPEKNGNYVSCINTLLNMGSTLSHVNRALPTPGMHTRRLEPRGKGFASSSICM